MANIKLYGNTWDTSGIYDEVEGKTQKVINADVSELKTALTEVEDIAIQRETETWWSNTKTTEAYTSSTFSGFASSWQNTSKKVARSLTISLRSRASSNITKIKVRLESDDSSFVYETIANVDVGSSKQRVSIPLDCNIPVGLIWVGVAADKIATFDHDDVAFGDYTYWTNGNFNLSNLKSVGGVHKRLAIDISYLDGLKIEDFSISQEKLSFSTFVEPENLIDVDDENQCKKKWWYYSTAVGQKISMSAVPEYNYTALTVKTYGASKITFDIFPHEVYQPRIYWIGAADENMVLLSYQIVNALMPVTYTMPEGAVYVLASLQSDSDIVLSKLMCVKGEEVTKYVKGFGERYLLNNCLIEDDGEKGDDVTLCLPDYYDLVVGDTFQLFKKGIVNATNTNLYDVQFVCNKGNAFERFFEITPNTAETLQLSVFLYGDGHKLLDSKLVNLIVRAKASSPSSTKYVLCVGDSLTQGGIWVAELNRRLTGSGGTPSGDSLSNVQFVGTREYNGTHYEGYGGWTFYSYNTANVDLNAKIITCTHDKTEVADQHSIYKASNNSQWKLETIESGSIKIISVSGDYANFPSSGTLTWVSGGANHSDIVYTASANAAGNPFWDADSGKVDFEKYCVNLSIPQIDYVLVLLGWNTALSAETTYKNEAQTFIDNVHTAYPNAKIVLIGLEIPARDGLASNYGATDGYANYYRLMNFVFNLDKWYDELGENNSNVFHFNLSGQFDTEYNMPTTTVQVNTRNSETIIRQSNGVHPAASGQYQIADAAYRCMTGLL